MPHRYTARFEAAAQIIVPTDDLKQVAKASLAPLANLLPAGLDPEADPDLLYISCNGAVAGLCNKNLDSISAETALAINASAKHKYINLEHDRDKIVGVVLYPGLTRFGSNEPITPEVAATLKEPFNMAFAGVIWKVVAPMISKYIAQQGDSTASAALSTSWEIAFDDYDIGVGSRNIFEAKVVKAGDTSFAVYDKYLRQNGGKGMDAAGQEVYRILRGDAVILGYGIVPNPAAEVKGILAVEKTAPAVAVQAALADVNEIFKLSDESLKQFGTALFKVARERGIALEQVDAAFAVSAQQLADALTLTGDASADVAASIEALTTAIMADKMQRLAESGEIEVKEPLTLPDGDYRAIRYGYTIEIVGLEILSCTKHDTKDGVRCSRENAPGPYLVEVKAGRVFHKMQDGKPLLWEASAQKSEEKNITPSPVSVTLNTPQSMKIETLEQLQSNWAEIRKCETAASVADFVKAIKDGSDKYMADLKAQEELVQNAELAKAANEKRANDLKASLDDVKKELAEVRASQEALQSNQKFQERMASLDDSFDLDDEDRAFITKDIKDLDDDSFAAYAKKCDKMMAAKKKKAPPFKKGDDKDDADPKDDGKDDATAAEIKAALASVQEKDGQTKLPNGVAVDTDVAEQMATAFGASMKIDGKTVAERKAARAAKK